MIPQTTAKTMYRILSSLFLLFGLAYPWMIPHSTISVRRKKEFCTSTISSERRQNQLSLNGLPRRLLHRHDFPLLKAAQGADDNGSEAVSLEESSIDLESLMEMDCFVFSRKNSNEKKLELGVLEERVLQPICAWTTEEAFDDYIEFVVDEEDRYSIDIKDVTIHSLIPSDSLSFGSRQVGGGKGPGNPHGEESELLYYIRREALEGLEVTVKPELEILW